MPDKVGKEAKDAWLYQPVSTFELEEFWTEKVLELLQNSTWTAENFHEAFDKILSRFHDFLTKKVIEYGILTKEEVTRAHRRWILMARQ